MGVDLSCYVNVYDLMMLDMPRCRLPRPRRKPTIMVTGWNEFLPLIDGSTGEILR